MINKAILLFCTGTLSIVQIKLIGYIGISELVCLLAAPVLLFSDYKILKRNGFQKVLVLAGLWIINGVLTDWYRQNTFENTLRGFANLYGVLASIIVLHHLLWDDIWRMRWFLLGVSVSVLLSTYVFPSGTSVEKALSQGLDAIEVAINYKLALFSVVSSVVLLPIVFFYLKIPFLSIGIIMVLSIFGLFQGGRSSFLTGLTTAGIMLLVGNDQKKMRHVHRHIAILAGLLIVISFVASFTYKKIVSSGAMGEEELQKYEIQSQSKIGVLSGRGNVIGCFLAISESPVLGYGSKALDLKGFKQRAAELIDAEDSVQYDKITYMPGHSILLGSWVDNGFFGFYFWVYVLFIIYRTMKYNLGVCPKLFGYLSITIPGMMWNIFFSGLGYRIITAAPIVVFLLLESMRQQAINNSMLISVHHNPVPITRPC